MVLYSEKYIVFSIIDRALHSTSGLFFLFEVTFFFLFLEDVQG